MIASLSGIRGIVNGDLALDEVSRLAANFARTTGSKQVLMARDPRYTGPMMLRAAAAGVMSQGATVVDYGIISTPALFRESRTKMLPAVMITASHNEPEFNGLKFVVDGAGIGREVFDAVVGGRKQGEAGLASGGLKTGRRPSYAEELVEKFGAGSCEGIRVAADLGGGAAISHAVFILRELGCSVTSLNDSYGVFTRKVDPVADDLSLLRKVVRTQRCDIGLAFDCDGDRLVIVDSEGRKRTGDFMLTLALSQMLAGTEERKVVVSLDTTRAVDDVVERSGGKVFRSPVGEANVVGAMRERGARLGGEGSSGGMIDGSFNYCRDSMLAALAIIRGLKERGKRLYESVPAYHQERTALEIPRAKAVKALRKLAKGLDQVDESDGLKIFLPNGLWVLIRPSGTEDVVRVSAEARSAVKARRLVTAYAKRLREATR